MFIRLVGRFEVRDDLGHDLTPRGAKARALLAMLCRTPDHRRPRRWLEQKLWSDRGQEQASGSLRQALTELRRALGPLAFHLVSDRDCVGLEGVDTDLIAEPEAARAAIRDGREFLEGIDIVDAAFLQWLAVERNRVSAQLGTGTEAPDQGPHLGQPFPIVLRNGPSQEVTEIPLSRDLASAIARLTADYLLTELAEAARGGKPFSRADSYLDVQVEGAWSENLALLRIRLVAQADPKTVRIQCLPPRRLQQPARGSDGMPTVLVEPGEVAAA
jgi:hypothetical protein